MVKVGLITKGQREVNSKLVRTGQFCSLIPEGGVVWKIPYCEFFVSVGSTGFSDLVEDKEVAARAVAFVVNSTRKGIVPLCADVANLLRSKKA